MKRTIITLGVALAGMTLNPNARADEAAEAISEKSAARYLEAWKSGDAAAVAALYAEGAEYTTDDGTLVAGREAIEERTAAALAALEGAELAIETESARFLTPEVIAENGYASVTLDGETTSTMYNLTLVKDGEDWLIAEVHESPVPDLEVDLSAEALTRLDWIIGDWKVQTEENDEAATLNAKWVLDGSYIARTITIPGEEADFVSVEMIGYDPVEDRIRSWVFDSEGGFGEATWKGEEGSWVIQVRATGPDGGVSSGDFELEIVDENTLSLKTTNRVLDGEVLPNREPITLTRTEEPSTAAEK